MSLHAQPMRFSTSISKVLCLTSCVSFAVHGTDLLTRRGLIQTLATYFIRTMNESAWSTRIFRSAVCNTVPSDSDGQMDSFAFNAGMMIPAATKS
jgi:hypothetical protein